MPLAWLQSHTSLGLPTAKRLSCTLECDSEISSRTFREFRRWCLGPTRLPLAAVGPVLGQTEGSRAGHGGPGRGPVSTGSSEAPPGDVGSNSS